MCAVFSGLGGAKKDPKEKKAGSGMELGERLVMEGTEGSDGEEEGPYCGARSCQGETRPRWDIGEV